MSSAATRPDPPMTSIACVSIGSDSNAATAAAAATFDDFMCLPKLGAPVPLATGRPAGAASCLNRAERENRRRRTSFPVRPKRLAPRRRSPRIVDDQVEGGEILRIPRDQGHGSQLSRRCDEGVQRIDSSPGSCGARTRPSGLLGDRLVCDEDPAPKSELYRFDPSEKPATSRRVRQFARRRRRVSCSVTTLIQRSRSCARNVVTR